MKFKLTSIIIASFFISVTNAQNVGIQTTTPKATFNVAAGKTVLFGADSTGAGVKMMWIPSKSAFRAGEVIAGNPDYWDYVNIGTGSVVLGQSGKASGLSSIVIQGGIASGWLSTTIGSSTATGNFSLAMAGSTASGQSSKAMGQNSIASGDFAVAIGAESAIAPSAYETVLGRYNTTYSPASANNWNSTDRLFTVGNGTASNATSDALVILKNGNMGIGTSNPAFPLNFATSNGDKISLWGNTPSGSSMGFGVQPGLLQIHSNNASDNIAFGYGSSTSFTELMRIKGNGNVGIGTTSPVFPLNFANTNGDKISLWGNSAGGSSIGFGVQPGLLQIHSNSTSDNIAFGYGSSASFTEQMRIKGNGNVGIGTTDPQTKLDVNGFTKLGEIAPTIKMKVLAGTTQPDEGGAFGYPMGIDATKILSVNIFVRTADTWIPPNFTISAGYEYQYEIHLGSNALAIYNKPLNSANILSKPFAALITYTE